MDLLVFDHWRLACGLLSILLFFIGTEHLSLSKAKLDRSKAKDGLWHNWRLSRVYIDGVLDKLIKEYTLRWPVLGDTETREV